MDLFDTELLDRLEGLNARYALLSKRIEEIMDEAAAFDKEPDRAELAKFETLRKRVKAEALELVEALLESMN